MEEGPVEPSLHFHSRKPEEDLTKKKELEKLVVFLYKHFLKMVFIFIFELLNF